jgi:hypothetical protein
MAYITRCTCTEDQLTYVGCDCDHTGPEKVVKTHDDWLAEAEATAAAYLVADRAAEIAYYEAEYAAETQFDAFVDPREDYADWAREAVKHQ